MFWEWRRHFGLLLHLFIHFFSHFKMIWKKLHMRTMMICTLICTCGKKIKVFRSLLSILIPTFWFQHMYKVLPNLTSFINLVNSDIFSKVVRFFWFLFSFEKLHMSSSISMVLIIKIIPHEWGITLVTRASKKTRVIIFKHPWPFKG